jgi:hypothetical protein
VGNKPSWKGWYQNRAEIKSHAAELNVITYNLSLMLYQDSLGTCKIWLAVRTFITAMPLARKLSQYSGFNVGRRCMRLAGEEWGRKCRSKRHLEGKIAMLVRARERQNDSSTSYSFLSFFFF